MKEVIEGWIARDKDDFLACYEKEPERGEKEWLVNYEESFFALRKARFPEQKWEDEPRKVLITIETIELDA